MKVNSLKVYLPDSPFERKAPEGQTFDVKIEGDTVLIETDGRLTKYVGLPYVINFEKPKTMTHLDWR